MYYDTINEARYYAYKMMQKEARIIYVIKMYNIYTLAQSAHLECETVIGWVDTCGYWRTPNKQRAQTAPPKLTPKTTAQIEREKTVDKIKKLLRHASDRATTQEESKAFRYKAHTLMTKHGISTQEVR